MSQILWCAFGLREYEWQSRYPLIECHILSSASAFKEEKKDKKSKKL